MKKSDTKQIVDELIADFIDICPHCRARAHLEMIFNESHIEKGGHVVYYILFRCKPCKKLTLETYRFSQNRYSNDEDLSSTGWVDKFPEDEVLFAKKFEGVVPDDVIEDFNEGVSCLTKKNLRAAVSMFRRSLQSALIERGAKKGEDLIDQIKNISTLTQDIKDWAHNIRIFGNWGSHPQNDNLKDINQEKAEEAQSFLEEFFNYVYVMPHRVAKARGVDNSEKEGAESVEEKE